MYPTSFQQPYFPARADFLFIDEFYSIWFHACAPVKRGCIGKTLRIGIQNDAAETIFPERLECCKQQYAPESLPAIPRADENAADATAIGPLDEFRVT